MADLDRLSIGPPVDRPFAETFRRRKPPGVERAAERKAQRHAADCRGRPDRRGGAFLVSHLAATQGSDSESPYNGIMKTTIDIPDHELKEVVRNTGAATKREAVVTAIEDYNRRKRLAKLMEQFGTLKGFMTQAELQRLRRDR